MPFPTMATKVNTVVKSLKIKITSRGIRADSEDKPRGNISKGLLNNEQKVNKDPKSGSKCSQLNANPYMPATPAKRKPEVSLDGQSGKKQKMDRMMKTHCGSILKELLSQTHSYIFSEPVDPVKLNIPDYFSIITEPMDLGTIKYKLDGNMYFSAEEFAADVKLTFSNATTYNPPGNYVHELAKKMDVYFSRKWKSLGARLKLSNNSDEDSFAYHVEKNGQVTKQTVENQRQCVKQFGPSKKKSEPSPDDKNLWKLKTNVGVADATCGKNKPARIALKVCSSLRSCQKEPCIRSSNVPTKQSQSVDCALAKCSSCVSLTCHCRLKNGSSEAAKSDISSEISSENNHCGDSEPCIEVKSPSGFHRSSSSLESEGPGVVIHEEKSPDPPALATTALSSAEGWTSLNVQMSPNKALRAAMLKSRFADTIFKATHQVEKVDPMKMQQEIERLEREKQEEKARIEAEMKAAEAASRREQHELKMKLERERAEARMALQKMEKSVEINESTDILKDVEMLCFGYRAAKTLERLGLYLKEDYLGEDDVDAALNAEEGEILS